MKPIRQKAFGQKIKKSTSPIPISTLKPTFKTAFGTPPNIKLPKGQLCFVPNVLSETLMNDIQTEIDRRPDSDWTRWHKKSHWAAPDFENWKDELTVWTALKSKIEAVFQVTLDAVRLNRFDDGEDHKPLHHDASAILSGLAQRQDCSIVLSIGHSRTLRFFRSSTRTTLDFEIPHGMIYAFDADLNRRWMHGIPKEDRGGRRYSIAFWGKRTHR